MKTSAALLFALCIAAQAAAYTTGAGTCPTSYDLGSNAWADGPHTTSTGGVSRWTIDRLANAGRIIVTIGGFEDEAGFFGTVQPGLPGQSSSGFALHFDDGRQVMSLENLVSFIEAVKARVPAGHARPLFFTDVRHDLLTQHDVMAAGVQRPSASWFLKSSRPLSTLAYAMHGPGLIAQTHPDCDSVPGGANDGKACGLTMCRSFDAGAIRYGELFGQGDLNTTGTHAGCGRIYDGTGNKARGANLYDLINEIEPDLADQIAYYKQRSGSINDNVVGFGIAALGNMLDTDYIDAKVERCKAYVAMGFDGCAQSHKDHFFATRDNVGGGDAGVVEAWPLIAGDGLGGTASSGTTTPFTDLTGDDGLQPFSGPLLQPDGVTPFAWSERARGERLIAEALDTAGVPVFAYINAYAYEGCDLDSTSWSDPTNYNDTGCDNRFDDGDGTYCETCSMRARGLNADYVLIDVQGKPFDGSEGGLGSGSGSGLSYADMKGILENFPSDDGTPPVVLGWLSADGFGTSTTSAHPPILCADPSEVNPLTVSVCGNGTLDPGEECDDSDTDPGDGCDQHCRKPHAFVLAGQSNMEGRSTQNQDTDTGRVTSPDSFSSHVSRVFRARYLFDTGASLPVWADANSWPCADAQCTDTVPGSCATRTAATNDSLDAQCRCHCGTSTDAWAGDLGELGSAWPTFAKRWMQDQGREVTFVSVNQGSTGLVDPSDSTLDGPAWDPTVDCSARSWPTGSSLPWRDEQGDMFCLVFHAVAQSGVGDSLKAVLWYQGEEDAAAGITEAAYEAALNELVDQVWARLGVPTIIAPLSLRTYPLDAWSTIPSGGFVNIRQAQLDVIASNPHAYRGPETNDLEHIDSVHIQDVITLGDRWAEASAHAIVGSKAYDGGQLSVCGNDHWERGETCDDGNTTAGDGCSATCTVESGTRDWRMGFGTYPAPDFDGTNAPADAMYTSIGEHADLVLEHFDFGVPWTEALADTAFDAAVEAVLTYRDGKLGSTQRVVSATPMNGDRDGLALYWDSDPNMALPAPFDGYDFSDPDVLTAYLNYCRRLIDDLGPTHFVYAIEANLLYQNSVADWPDFLAFAEDVYTTLKAEYPDLWLFPSIHIGAIELDRTNQEAAVTDLLAFSDMVAVSAYPYLDAKRSPGTGTYNDPSALPADWFSQVADLAPTKAFGIAETGFHAERLLTTSPSAVDIEGREAWQRDYVIRLMDEADTLNAHFVAWFVHQDYDAWWDALSLPALGGFPESYRIFKDTGLINANGDRRGLAVWDNWLARSYSAPAAVCGNNVLESGEACEDGNTSNGDGCSSTCTIEGASLSAAFDVVAMQGTTCVAPCVVHFDAIGDGTSLTTSDTYSREFHTLKYRWDFDDVGSGTWSTGASGGASRNAGEGAIQAHVYYTAGTYDPVLTVTDPSGNTDTDTVSITVTNPDTHFSGTTFCVSTSGTFTGCTGTNITSSDFDDVMTNNSLANADANKVRVRFRGGETFFSTTSVALSTAAGPGMIDSYGTGKAIFEKSNPETAGTLATLSQGWTVHNVETDIGLSNSSTWVLPVTTTATHGASVIGTNCLQNANYCVSTNGASSGGSPYNAAFVDNVTEAFQDPDGGGPLGSNDPAGGVFYRHNNMVVMGNDMTSPRYMTRTVHANKAIFAHNSYEVTVNPNNPFQLRSCDSSALSCGGDNTVQQSRWIIVADNLFESFEPTGNTIVKLCDDSRCSSTDVDLTGLGGLNDVIIERNLDRYIVGGSGQVGSNGFVGFHSGTDITIRNNVRDAQGIASTGSSLAFASFTTFTEQPGVRVHVYNNTLYTDDTAASKTVDLCVSSSSYMTSGFCYGNLSYTPNVGGAKNATVGSGWTSADNVFATSSPFTATPPTQGATALSSFAIAPAGQADGTGYDFTGTDLWNMLDAGGCLRAAPWDAGAWQIGAGSCLP